MTINLIPRDKTNTPLKVKSIQWQEYFSFLNNYVADGLELSSLSPTDISIGIGAGRINGLIVIVDSAEVVTVTGNGTRYCHLHIVRANGVDPSSVEIVFLDAKSDDKDYLFIGSAVANGDGTGFDTDTLDVSGYSGLTSDYFGTGVDGIVTLNDGDSIEGDMNYDYLNITGTVNVLPNTIIRVRNSLVIDGVLSSRGNIVGGKGGDANDITDGVGGIVASKFINAVNRGGDSNGGSAGGERAGNNIAFQKSKNVFVDNVSSGSGSGGGGGNETGNASTANGGDGGKIGHPDGYDGTNSSSALGGGSGGGGGSGAGNIFIMARTIKYRVGDTLDLRGGNGGNGALAITNGNNGGVGGGGDGGVAVIICHTDKGYADTIFRFDKGLKGVTGNIGNATDGVDGIVLRGFV